MTITLALLLAVVAPSVMAEDACQAKFPTALRERVAEHFEAFRLPVVADNLEEDVVWSKEHNGDECLGAASADFDGDGTKDFLLGLTSNSDSSALVVVALAQDGEWKIHKLAFWPTGRNRLYVAAEKPGTYVSLFDPPYPPGGVDRIDCANWVAVFGATESTGVAYCYVAGTWQHAWFSD
jgi:hypothetical protein